MNAFSQAAAEDQAFLHYFSPEERVARKFPDLPRIEHAVPAEVAKFHGFDPVLLARAARIKLWWRRHGVPYELAMEAALEAEKKPTVAEIQAWRASR